MSQTPATKSLIAKKLLTFLIWRTS